MAAAGREARPAAGFVAAVGIRERAVQDEDLLAAGMHVIGKQAAGGEADEPAPNFVERLSGRSMVTANSVEVPPHSREVMDCLIWRCTH